VRTARNVFGGRATGGTPVVTWTLVGINVAIYLVELLYPKIIDLFGMVGSSVAHGEWYRLITAAFLHSTSPLHVLFNMWALVVIGPQLEGLLGRLRFASVYLISALGGSVLAYLVARPTTTLIGASTAVFGLFGAWFVVSRRLRLDTRWIAGLIGINLVIGYLMPFVGVAGTAGHAGGLAAGAVITTAYAYAPSRQRQGVQVGATVALMILLAVVVMVRTSQLSA
jgi:membrane associated rhomboid family serine protease